MTRLLVSAAERALAELDRRLDAMTPVEREAERCCACGKPLRGSATPIVHVFADGARPFAGVLCHLCLHVTQLGDGRLAFLVLARVERTAARWRASS